MPCRACVGACRCAGLLWQLVGIDMSVRHQRQGRRCKIVSEHLDDERFSPFAHSNRIVHCRYEQRSGSRSVALAAAKTRRSVSRPAWLTTTNVVLTMAAKQTRTCSRARSCRQPSACQLQRSDEQLGRWGLADSPIWLGTGPLVIMHGLLWWWVSSVGAENKSLTLQLDALVGYPCQIP